MYQLIQDNEIPQNTWDAALFKEDEEKLYYQIASEFFVNFENARQLTLFVR